MSDPKAFLLCAIGPVAVLALWLFQPKVHASYQPPYHMTCTDVALGQGDGGAMRRCENEEVYCYIGWNQNFGHCFENKKTKEKPKYSDSHLVPVPKAGN